jgi:hypothetical protein
VAAAAFLASISSLSLRPQLLGALLFAVCLWIVAGRHERPGLLWAIPGVVALWANVHGSFFLAPLLLVLAWLEDRGDGGRNANRTLWVAAAAGLATLVSPFGPRVWTYVFGLATNPTISAHISEWRPPAITRIGSIPFFASAAAVVVLLSRRGRPTRWTTLVYLGIFLALGLVAARNTLWWALAVAPVAAAILQERSRKPDATFASSANFGVAALLGIAFIAFFPWSFVGAPFDAPGPRLANAPAGITAELEAVVRPDDHIFVPQIWGSWFEFALPENPVFVDSRIEVFPKRVWDQYFAVSVGKQGWQRVLDRWDVTALVVNEGQQSELIPLVRRDPGWRLVYRDGDGLVFLRG